MTEPPAPGLNLTWRAVALAVCDTVAVFVLAGVVDWVAACAWGWLTS